jgi:hypothetical protein
MGLMEFGCVRLKIGGKKKDTLGFEGTPNARDGGGKFGFEVGLGLRLSGAVVEGTLQDVRQHQAQFLKISEDGFRGLPLCGDVNGVENRAGFAVEGQIWRV